MLKETDIALGFYHSYRHAKEVFHRVQDSLWERCVLIHRGRNNDYTITRNYSTPLFWGVLLGLVITLLMHFFGLTEKLFPLEIQPHALIFFTTSLLSFVIVYRSLFYIKKSWIDKYKPLLLHGETLILTKVPNTFIANTMKILQNVAGETPITFLFRTGLLKSEEPYTSDIHVENYPLEKVPEMATAVAHSHKVGKVPKSKQPFLLERLRGCETKINTILDHLEQSLTLDQTIGISRDWLLDNAYAIRGKISEVKKNLPKAYYEELPKLVVGPFRGLPRIYAIAYEILGISGGGINQELIEIFMKEYQKITPITIGELWALPLMLTIRLIEILQFLAFRVDLRLCESELAALWGNRLVNVARHEPSELKSFMRELNKDVPNPSGHFAEELLSHLSDEDITLIPVRSWIEDKLQASIVDIVRKQQLEETTEQTALVNAITSLIKFYQYDWRDILERVSVVDEILNKDPAGVYPRMDFKTRDIYRHAIEENSLNCKIPEVSLASYALILASGPSDVPLKKHVGYYLIDDGIEELEKVASCQLSSWGKLKRWFFKHPSLTYLGSLLFLVAATSAAVLYYIETEAINPWIAALFIFLGIFPISEVCIQVLNLFITNILKPTILPKMSYEETGIPDEYKTLIIVPTMLSSRKSILEDIEELQIRYLANSDPNLKFALFTDYLDGSRERMPEDQDLINLAKSEIQRLNGLYGDGKFFLFHRERIWNPAESIWMGRERKRGKLEDLNRYLSGEVLEDNNEILIEGNKKDLDGIRYIIALDTDTQLPKDKARRLIETLSHPLNKPYLAESGKSILRGYTIIQPSVSTSLPSSNATYFSRIFTDTIGTNPYTQTVSDVYQDLSGEGCYYGKGIYDLKTFHKLLSSRFPKGRILSHDLLEGTYVRTGFASDIELFDNFPSNYRSYALRQHRWLRGDWQISSWLFPKVPSENKGKQPNPLSALNRWKILDNLRRSIAPAALLAMLLLSWYVFPQDKFWTAFIAIILLMPAIAPSLISAMFAPFETLTQWKHILTGVTRCIIYAALLPHQAYISIDAFCRYVYRRFISHKKLLEWTPSSIESSMPTHVQSIFILKMFAVSLFTLAIAGWIAWHSTEFLKYAWPFLSLWFLSPFIVALLNKPYYRPISEELNFEDRIKLRNYSRWTWRFFDQFVGPSSNWLPPDNFQDSLNVELARRTSPTNIGLALLTYPAVYHLGYLSFDETIGRIKNVTDTLKKLERFEGHFYNWYDIGSLLPLEPKYISTVDSGNLLASYWALANSLIDLLKHPLLSRSALEGIKDTFEQVKDKKQVEYFYSQLNFQPLNIPEIIAGLKRFDAAMKEKFHEIKSSEKDLYWISQAHRMTEMWLESSNRYLQWMDPLNKASEDFLKSLDPQAVQWKIEALKFAPSLEALSSGKVKGLDQFIHLREQTANLSPDQMAWLNDLEALFSKSQWLAGELMGITRQLHRDIHKFADETDMAFLYQKNKKAFSIGFNATTRRMDTSCYDLLASEARLSSLVSIAKGDAPLEHWWTLGRPYTDVDGKKVLLSWGGTMFEYLMPLIWTHNFKNSLLDQACTDAVEVQMNYGKRLGLPWGISEAAYSAIDMYRIYQYRSFGIPGMGMKRGLEKDLVVSPYSTGLALMIKPKAALENFADLIETTRGSIEGTYGFYEAVDYSRQKDPKGERGVIVHTYMAHHEGMTLLSMVNVLRNNLIQNYFHADPRIQSIESLLYERIPTSTKISEGFARGPRPTRLELIAEIPSLGRIDSHESHLPKVNILSNNILSSMLTNAGGGYIRWEDLDITRWRADTTKDDWGSFCYIKDVDSNAVWSTFFQPTVVKPKRTIIHFTSDKAEFRRVDEEIETVTEIVISPEDNAEIRRITLLNLSRRTRTLELTSYMELAMSSHDADRSHPAFNKMFIQTEALPKYAGVIASRRPRSPDDKPIYVAHCTNTYAEETHLYQFETDRSKFIGRGRTLRNPIALEGNLQNSEGFVLDPIMSLRRQIVLKPNEEQQIVYVTIVSRNRDEAEALVEKYRDINASNRALDMAWTHAQLELRHLRINAEDAQLYQKLAGRIIFPNSLLRPSTERLRRNRLGQPGLWAYGISGDIPIVIVTIKDYKDYELVKEALLAHAYLKMRGLKTDLVIINEEDESYDQTLYQQLLHLVQVYALPDEIDKSGGVFLRSASKIPEQDLTLLLASASIVMVASRGTLKFQLLATPSPRTIPPMVKTTRRIKDEPSNPLPFMELLYFNGVGGFTKDAHEYSIYLGPQTQTPAPWINVLSNKQFGALVTESGLCSTWNGNSQTNRLTPWCNDPVIDPPSEAIYIHDNDLNVTWSPTPKPIREKDAYRVSHGQGYTRFEHNSHNLEQQLLIFVPVDEDYAPPIKIQKLKIFNRSTKRRSLTITGYVDWVLGSDKEASQMHLISDWDPESQSLFVTNPFQTDNPAKVAFFSSSPLANTFTADRTEFIGRNGNLSNPDALKRISLSGTYGGALDPCGALQVNVNIEPESEAEVTFLLGEAADVYEARRLILLYRDPMVVEEHYFKTCAWWNKILDTTQINTPWVSTNLLMNRWLLYQVLSCRVWARNGFYQSSGAYGFRDQLQDVMSLVYSKPEFTRAQILLTAHRQFLEGDVQHWWHPATGAGVRTKISDDLLWLPFVTAHYVKVTGDKEILNENIPYLQGPILQEHEHELYFIPQISEESANLLDHCKRAIVKGVTAGSHGIPLIGSGDWNDGMNRVGIEGKGESVWLGWFLVQVLNDFSELLDSIDQQEPARGYRSQAKRLVEALEAHSWDGNWYKRAYYDDGTPLGSMQSVECKIDSISQSWAVITGECKPERAKEALKAVDLYMVRPEERLVLLLTPPFDTTPKNPGYIKGYPPGVRENGGQYTHGSLWAPLAFAKFGDGSKASYLLQLMNPIERAKNEKDLEIYKIEPYVMPGDVYALPGNFGRGGWSWYTGSASWKYRIWLEDILGFKLRNNVVTIDPTLPSEWSECSINYRFKDTFYLIKIKNPKHLSKGKVIIKQNGKVLPENSFELVDDHAKHEINVTID